MNDTAAAPLVTRFAPSPTGYLHLGHVRNAIEVWDFARTRGARVLLRIEDHDRQRSKPEYETAIREDLEWLGFHPDAEVPRQSSRSEVYLERTPGVESQIRLPVSFFGCSCSRNQLAEEPRYPGTCRDKQLGLREGLSWRVRMEPGVETFTDLRLGLQAQDPSAQCGDVLIRDRLGNWSYQWCVTIDDFLQGVTHVIRGEDLLDSTSRQIRIGRLIGRDTPPAFLHHALIMRDRTHKLSKSDHATGIRELRRHGLTADDVRELAKR